MVSVATNSLLQAGIAAAQAGNRLLARMHLEAAVYQEHDNPQAWLWLAWTADSPTHAISCLEWVLHFDRKNELALAGLVWARRLQGFKSQTDLSQLATTDEGSGFVEFAFETTPNPYAVEAAAGSTDVCVAESAVATVADESETGESDGTAEFDGRDKLQDTVLEFRLEPDFGRPSPESPPLLNDIEDRIESTQELITQEIQDDSQIESPAALSEEWFEDEWFEDDFLTAGVECRTAPGERPSLEDELSDEPSDEFIDGLINERTDEPFEVPLDFVADEPDATVETPAIGSDFVCSEGVFEFELHEPVEAPVEPEPVVAELQTSPIADSECFLEADSAELETSVCQSTSDDELLVDDALIGDPIELIETPPAKLRVLVVDDSVTVRKLIALTLAKHGYEVFEAEDGVAALRDIGLHVPDLVLADINMPKLDGYRLCRLVKSHENTKHIPVILVSGLCGEEHLLRGKLVGCDAYITKPVVPDAVLAAVVEQFAMGLELRA